MAAWIPQPNADGTINSWVREDTGGGTPIWQQVDEGIAAADNTGIKNATTGNTGFLQLSDSPSDLADGSAITAATIKIRGKQSGRVDDTNVLVSVTVYKANETTQVDNGSGSLTVTTTTSYANSGAIDIFTGASASWTALTKAELDGLRVRVVGTRTVSMSADSITYFLDSFDLTITYTPSFQPRYGFVHFNNPAIL